MTTSSAARNSGLRQPALTLDNFLPYRLNVVTQAVSQALARLYSQEFGISIPEWRVIAALGEHGEMTARDIAAHGRLGKVAVSRAVSDLAGRKLVLRRANREDRRESFLRLSARGQAIYAAIVPRALAFQDALEDGIAHEDAAAFARVVRHLLERASAAEAILAGEPQADGSGTTSSASREHAPADI